MAIKKLRDLLMPFVTLCLILGTSFILIAYGRGYRVDVEKNKLKPTGIISATSDPIGAQVYINGKLKTATNNSINVDPGLADVKIFKEGYMSWEKKIQVQAEVVFRADAFLFPTNPNLSSLTTLGIERAALSPDGTKIAYIVPKNSESPGKNRAGLWILELAERPLGRNRDPQQIGESDPIYDFSNGNILWSPDSTKLLVDNGISIRLYQIKNIPAPFTDVTLTYKTTLKDWAEERSTRDLQKLAAFPAEIINIATSSAKIIAFSPDETKLLYQATGSANIPGIINPPLIGANTTEQARAIKPGSLYVYDVHEDKNFFVLETKELPQPLAKKSRLETAIPYPIQWFPTSRHFLLTLNGKIDVMEYDRTNWITVYAGPFNQSFVAPWPNGSRLVIITSLNPGATSMSNLYTVNFR